MRVLNEEAPASDQVTLPLVKFVNDKFKSTFRTEKVGLNTFMISEVFDEVNFRKDAAANMQLEEVKTEKINAVKMLA